MPIRWRFVASLCAAWLGLAEFELARSVRAADEPPAERRATLVVNSSITLDPKVEYGAIEIKASDVTIDGQGAKLIGAKSGDPAKFQGTAIVANGVTGVTVRNVVAKGWETGLKITDSERITIEDCDFSDNFHDPKFGWGENGRRGGIVLERVKRSTVRRCKANRVWDACVLVESDDNDLLGNDFSRTSNTCLKLWNSSNNKIRRNDLSYGIRKDPGEVHARDSTCVLIESGSNNNRFFENDCRYGGDGIFIRVLNGWVSTGNYFERNDCSYANNNCVEAWSPRNTWIRNKANYGSYGFWLGASDQNVLLDNEASFNGLADGNHNSPHLPNQGHAGIVFMFGPSSHTVVRGNRCEGNNGAGIAAIGDLDSKGKKWNAFHWIIEQNTLSKNRWGIYLEHVEMIDIAGNRYQGNTEAEVREGQNLIDVRQHDDRSGIVDLPRAILEGPSIVKIGEPAVFDASRSRDQEGRKIKHFWRMQPEGKSESATWTPEFKEPGFYRLALTVNNGRYSDMAWRDIYAIRDVKEIGTERGTADWDWIDPKSQVKFEEDFTTKLLGNSSLRARVQPYSGGRVTLRMRPTVPTSLRDRKRIVFWLKVRNENVPAWQDVNPIVELASTDGKALRFVPARDLLSQPPYNEAREGWLYFSVPLAGSDLWKRSGEDFQSLDAVQLGFDSWGAPPLLIWVDGLGFE